MRIDNVSLNSKYTKIETSQDELREGETIEGTVIEKKDDSITLLLSNGKTLRVKGEIPSNLEGKQISLVISKIKGDTIIASHIKEDIDISHNRIDTKIEELLIAFKIPLNSENIAAAKTMYNAQLSINEGSLKEIISGARVIQALSSFDVNSLSSLIQNDLHGAEYDLKETIRLIGLLQNEKGQQNENQLKQLYENHGSTIKLNEEVTQSSNVNKVEKGNIYNQKEHSTDSTIEQIIIGDSENVVKENPNLKADIINIYKEQDFKSLIKENHGIDKQNINFIDSVNRYIFIKKNDVPIILKNILAQIDLFDSRTMKSLIEEIRDVKGEINQSKNDESITYKNELGQNNSKLYIESKDINQLHEVAVKVFKNIIGLAKEIRENKDSLIEDNKVFNAIRLENALTLPKEIGQNYSYLYLPYTADNRTLDGHLLIKKNLKGKTIDQNNTSILISLSTRNIGVIDCYIRVLNRSTSLKFFVDSEDISKILTSKKNQIDKYIKETDYTLTNVEIEVKGNKDIFERISMLDSIPDTSIDIRV